MRQAPLLMDVTAEFTGGCTGGPTAAPTTRVLPPITALGLTTVLLRTITALAPITAVPACTLVLGVGIDNRREARQPRNNSEPARLCSRAAFVRHRRGRTELTQNV